MAPRDPKCWLWISLWRLGNFASRLKFIRDQGFFCKFRGRVEAKLAGFDGRFADGVLPDEDAASKFERIVDRVRPEIVMVNYYVLAPLFDKMRDGNISKVVLTHNARHQAIDRQTELACLQKADVLLAIQEEDAKEFKEALPGKNVLLFAIPYETVDHAESPKPGRVLFVGGNHYTNVEGLRWFLEKVWPNVQKRSPEAEFHVCGSVCEHFKELIPQVSFLGRLEDLTPEYAEASVVVAPLLDGSGLKIKLVDALRHGRPVVATSVGLQGVGFTENVCTIRADSPAAFAAAILHLFENDAERQTMQRQARAMVRERFSCQSCVQPFLRWCLETC